VPETGWPKAQSQWSTLMAMLPLDGESEPSTSTTAVENPLVGA
jgi:hypothetical protein